MSMHKSGLGLMEPVALIGHNVAIHYGKELHLRRVTYMEAIPPFQAINVGAMVLQSVSIRTLIPNLGMLDNEFGQFRWWPLDPIQVRLFIPNSQAKHVLRNIMVPMDPTVIDRDPCLHLTEFYVWQDNQPSVEVINYSDYALTQTRIMAMGFRFHVDKLPPDLEKKISEGQEPVTQVWCSGNQ